MKLRLAYMNHFLNETFPLFHIFIKYTESFANNVFQEEQFL